MATESSAHSLDWFWGLISQAGRSRTALEVLLRGLSKQELIRFGQQFQDLAVDLQSPAYTEHLGNASEDTVADIADWVVTQGKDYYDQVLAHPEQFPTEVPGGILASFSGVADNICYERFKELIP